MYERIAESLNCQIVLLRKYHSEYFVSLAAVRLLDLMVVIKYLALW